jgi:WD40 repeat protein
VEGRRDLRILVGHTGSVWSVAFSPDGEQGISGGIDGTVRIWNLFRGTEIKRLDGHDSLVSGVAFSADGTRAISGGYDGAVIWWDIRGSSSTGKELRRFELRNRYIHAVALHPTRPLAAIAAGEEIILWNPTTGDVVRRWPAHERAATCLQFFESGQVLVSGGDDGHVKVWNPESDRCLVDLTGHDGGIRGVDLKPGTGWLLSAGTDQTVRLWNLTTKAETAVFRQHTATVLMPVFLPSGRRTLSGDRGLTDRIWDISRFLSNRNPAAITPSTPPQTIPPAN